MKALFTILLILGSFLYAKAQTPNPPTSYGVGAGTIGKGSSYYGHEAGHSAIEVGEEHANSFFGDGAGRNLTFGGRNTGIGYQALNSVTSQSANTAIGYRSLALNVGGANTAIGTSSLSANRAGVANVAVGTFAMSSGNAGNYNVAVGHSALSHNFSTDKNTAVGTQALHENGGSGNTAIGYRAIHFSPEGSYNTAVGYETINKNAGHFNSAFGAYALANAKTGSLSSAFGTHAGPNIDYLTNTTALGFSAVPTASNQVRIGNTSITSIGGKVSWSTFSDGRFKKDIKNDVPGLSFINQLRPVNYTLDENAVARFLGVPDSLIQKSQSSRQSGFIAQEVEAIMKRSGYNFSGIEKPQNDKDHYAIRYAEFVVPLVKAVQELSMEVESLKEQLSLTKSITAAAPATGAVLFQNSPNPFSIDSEIRMSLPDNSGNATLSVYNLEGRQLKTISVKDRGEVLLKISGNELQPGMYLYSLIVDGKLVDTKRMVLTGN